MSDKAILRYKGSPSVREIPECGSVELGKTIEVPVEVAAALVKAEPEAWMHVGGAELPTKGKASHDKADGDTHERSHSRKER
jgi:hypothetical protein